MAAVETTPTLSAPIIKHARAAFDKITANKIGFDAFLKQLTSAEYSAPTPIDVDTSQELSQYFISSSHNTYLTGNQLWSKGSVQAYKDVLKRGCRCVEIDVWDGETPSSSPSTSDDETPSAQIQPKGELRKLEGKLKTKLKLFSSEDSSTRPVDPDSPGLSANEAQTNVTPWRSRNGGPEPRVFHGYTATKAVSFRSVCETIRDYAWKVSDMPLIVSLEIHTSHEQQEKMVEIIEDCWKPWLVPVPSDASSSLPLPTLESLRKKILVKVKYAPPGKAAAAKKNVGEEASEDEDQTQQVKKGKIIPELGRLGIYTRSTHFEGFSGPTVSIPTHVFSLSESKFLSVLEKQREAMFEHNRKYLMRAYPKGVRVNSSNLDPAVFWRYGVQIVALNWQDIDEAMMLNDAMFAGTGGWVLKPKSYRNIIGADSNKELGNAMGFDMVMTIFAAEITESHSEKPKAYVKCELHVGSDIETSAAPGDEGMRAKGGDWKRSSHSCIGRSCDFGGEVMTFKGVNGVVPELSFVRVKICNNVTFGDDELLGWTSFRLDRFPTGLRLFPLKGPNGKPGKGSILLDTEIYLR